MPRIRTIKPEFFEDDKIASLNYAARLCFIGLWTLADDFGTTDKLPEVIKGHLFPFDNDPELDVEKFLQEMENLGLIIRYGPRKRYIYIKNFHKHQHINRPSKKRSAPPPEDFGVPVSKEYIEFVKRVENRDVVVKEPPDTTHETLTEYSVSPHGVVYESSVSTHPKEKEREMEREKEMERELEKEKNNLALSLARKDLSENLSFSDVCPLQSENNLQESEKSKKAYKGKTKVKDPPLGKGNGIPPCPYEEIVDLYHEVLPELPAVRSLNEMRKKFVRGRWREVFVQRGVATAFLGKLPRTKGDGLLWFRKYFEHVRGSDFLMGRVSRKNKDPWQATFEWLMRPTNFAKVVEGYYHPRELSHEEEIRQRYDDIISWMEEDSAERLKASGGIQG